MFEAVVTLCLSLADGPCRDHLLPGYESDAESMCITALDAAPPEIVFPGLTAKGPAVCVPSGVPLAMTEVAPGVFVHMGEIAEPDSANRGDVSNLGFIIGDEAVAVIDAGTARWMGEALWRAIRLRTDKPVAYVILTHMHPDHVLGASAVSGTGAQVVGHAGLPRALADRQENYMQSLDRLIGSEAFLGTRMVTVDVTVADVSTLDLGNRALDLKAWSNAHTGTDLTVFDRTSGTLFTGDLVFDRHAPALDGSLTGWQTVLGDMVTMDAARIIPGHGGPVLGWPDGADDLRRYLSVLAAETRAALAAGERLGTAVTHIAASEADRWALFDAYNARNATVAYTELEWE